MRRSAPIEQRMRRAPAGVRGELGECCEQSEGDVAATGARSDAASREGGGVDATWSSSESPDEVSTGSRVPPTASSSALSRSQAPPSSSSSSSSSFSSSSSSSSPSTAAAKPFDFGDTAICFVLSRMAKVVEETRLIRGRGRSGMAIIGAMAIGSSSAAFAFSSSFALASSSASLFSKSFLRLRCLVAAS